VEKIYYTLDQLQEEEFKLLLLFKEICERNHLRYSLSAGTLLGAIRHKGFIPWDDDADVMMPREDYELFLSLCEKGLPDGIFMQTFLSDKKYLNGFGKLLNTKKKAFIKETEKLDIIKGICIDIFPIDRCHNSFWQNLYYIANLSICSTLKYSLLDNLTSSHIKKIVRYFARIITEKISSYRINLYECNFKKKYNSPKNKMTFASYDTKPPYMWRKRDMYAYELFEDYTEAEFHGSWFSVIKDYDKYLKITYGDYMTLPPKEKQTPNHSFYYYI